jgi:hypothetical protein
VLAARDGPGRCERPQEGRELLYPRHCVSLCEVYYDIQYGTADMSTSRLWSTPKL